MLVCSQRVVADRFGGRAERAASTIYLQILVDRSGFEPLISAVQRPPFQSSIGTGSTRKCRISRGIVRVPSQAMPARTNEDRAVGLQKGCRRRTSRLTPGMQEEAVDCERIAVGDRLQEPASHAPHLTMASRSTGSSPDRCA